MNAEAEHFYKKGVEAVFAENKDAAEFFLLKSAEIEPSEMSYGCLGWFYGTILQQENKALRFFRKAILQNPRNGDLYNDYGALLLKTGHFQDSVKWFLRAVHLSDSQKKHFALYNLALVYRNCKQPERSLRYLRLALKYQPEFQEARQLYSSILRDDLRSSPYSLF